MGFGTLRWMSGIACFEARASRSHLVLKRIGIVWALREEDPLQLRRSERVAGRRIVCTAAHGAVAERDRDRLFI
jgi:hypothetical protein